MTCRSMVNGDISKDYNVLPNLFCQLVSESDWLTVHIFCQVLNICDGSSVLLFSNLFTLLCSGLDSFISPPGSEYAGERILHISR